MSNRGRHKKKKDNKIHPKITVYNDRLGCYVTFYIKNSKLEIENVKPRQTQKIKPTFSHTNIR